MSTIQFNMARTFGQECMEPTAEICDFDIVSTNGYLQLMVDKM
jgi:hypothetical protein